MSRPALAVAVAALSLASIKPAVVAGQAASLAPVRASGQSVTPVFEGWYRNPDGTYSLSFGYLNRNSKEVVEIPIGPDNTITGGGAAQIQPTSFSPRRHWGVFAVKVPANFPTTSKVTWTLKNRGETYAIPGGLHPDWEIDALKGDAADNTPPAIKFSETGPEGRGPGGIVAGPMSTSVGKPLPLTMWASDEVKTPARPTTGRGAAPSVAVAFFKHQGPGDVTFAPAAARVPSAGGPATTTATFSKPGEYVLRVRLNDSSVEAAGHSQCCWTNGFLRVTVTP